MKKDMRQLTIRMESSLVRKLDYVAEYDGRSMTGLINALVRRYITSFEQQNGPIEFPEDKSEET